MYALLLRHAYVCVSVMAAQACAIQSTCCCVQGPVLMHSLPIDLEREGQSMVQLQAAPGAPASPNYYSAVRQAHVTARLAFALTPAWHFVSGNCLVCSYHTGAAAGLYLSVKVHWEERLDLQPVAGVPSGTCDTLRIAVTPGVIVTNLTRQLLHVAPCRAASVGAEQAVPLAPGATEPVLAPWRGPHLQQHALLVSLRAGDCEAALRVLGKADDVAHAAPAGRPAQSGPAGFAESFVSFLEGEAGGQLAEGDAAEWASMQEQSGPHARLVPLLAATGRRTRLLLADADAQVLHRFSTMTC